MSFFASLTKKSKLDTTTRKAAKARTNDSAASDQLLTEIYQDFADIIAGDALRATTLYQWGVTLLHQAKSKSAPESINIYRNAIAKFSFCMTIDPNYLAAAIDAGVACMDLARARGVPYSDELYEMAEKQFDKANSIQGGVAAFNLACLHGVRGKDEACLAALNIARENGNLPDDEDILADPDLANVIKQSWFKDFMISLEEDRRIAEEKRLAAKAAEEEARKPKPKNQADYDPYKPVKKVKDVIPDTVKEEVTEPSDESIGSAKTQAKKSRAKKASAEESGESEA